MPKLKYRVPSYRLHKPSFQAVVTLNGKDFYLGRYGTPESKRTYEHLISEWLASNRRMVQRDAASTTAASTIEELFLAYWSYAESYYAKDGRPASTLYRIKGAMRTLHQLYGRMNTAEFGPLMLKTVRERMVDCSISLNGVNEYIGIIKRIFKWGTENELVDATVYHALRSVSGLRSGRDQARETKRVGPVPEPYVDAVIPHLSNQLQAMIQLQMLTGMRHGEATGMRGCNLDMTGSIWTYKPGSHTTEHHGRQRIIYIGPRAQTVIRPFLKQDLPAYLFSPADAEAERNAQRRGDRRSPMTPSQACGRPKNNSKKTPRERYDKDSYRRAMQRACDKAGVPRWCPNQLRHNAATFLRKEFGIEAARVILGHSSADTTEIYAGQGH